ncbi:MAG: hypothetical protein RL154_1279 [Pseudomonadota bacterium]|jgi:REP element-mobilizing transposase RayT
MPRQKRITINGFYHIINRGVERRNIFLNKEDYEKFLLILKDVSNGFNFTIHAFCLMSNHYHLLIETKSENISDAIQKLNASYAVCFNTTYNRSGHLWQGRYQSYYINNDEHFWIVAKYIERNPLKASIVSNLEAYKYQSYFYFLNSAELNDSIIVNSKIFDMNIADYKDFILTPFDSNTQKSVYGQHRNNKDVKDKKVLTQPISDFFQSTDTRNEKIANCYKYGYTKAAIAEFLGLSKMMITKILQN